MGAAANPNMVTNPFQQASQAQMGALGAMNPAMNRVGQGMTQIAADGMANYQNPYEDQVVQASMRDIGNKGLQMQNTLGSQATAAGAFGGSRHGIAEAELAKSTQQQMLDQAARLRQQGFNTALGASQADLGRQLGAAGQLSGMAGNLANLGGQSFGYGQAINNQQMTQGAMQQQLMQNLINAGKGQYDNFTNAPMNKLTLPLTALGAAPQPESTTTGRQLGIMDYLTAGAQMYAGMPF